MIPNELDSLMQELFVLMSCVSAAISHLQEYDTPFEQRLSRALLHQQLRVTNEIKKIEE